MLLPTIRFAAVLLCLALAQAVFAQATVTSHVQGVNVTLAYAKTRIAVGEPVVLKLTLENVSAEPIVDFNSSLQFPPGNGVEVEIQPPEELPYHFSGGLEPGNYPDVVIPLKPFKPVSIEMLVLYDGTQASGFAFGVPGTYQVSTTLRFGLRHGPEMYQAAMPPTAFGVAEPAGDEAEALKLFADPGLVRALQVSAAPSTGILTALTDISARYPATQLGALSLKAAGNQLALLGNPTADERVRGAEMLTRYLANGVVVMEPDRVAINIAGAYHLAGQPTLALEWVKWILRTHPDSPYVNPYDAVIGYYYYDAARHAREVPWYLMKEPWKVPGAKPPENLNPRKEAN